MKPDTERRKYYKAKNHQKSKRMNVHLSKELRGKMKTRKRSALVRKGDRVRVMRGPSKGTSAKVVKVSHTKMKVYLEGVSVRNARAREVMVPLSPSNLELIGLEKTKEREVFFSEAAFSKEKKEEKKKLDVKVGQKTVEAEIVEDEKPEKKAEEPKAAKPAEAPKEAAKPETSIPKPEAAKR